MSKVKNRKPLEFEKPDWKLVDASEKSLEKPPGQLCGKNTYGQR